LYYVRFHTMPMLGNSGVLEACPSSPPDGQTFCWTLTVT
jgi:hypothetical protein